MKLIAETAHRIIQLKDNHKVIYQENQINDYPQTCTDKILPWATHLHAIRSAQQSSQHVM